MAWFGQIPLEIHDFVVNKLASINKASSKNEWKRCLESLRHHKYYIWNEPIDECSNTFPSHLWTFLHHAAYHSAPIEIVQTLSIQRFPLSLPDTEGKLAIDHVDQEMSSNYKELYQPIYQCNFMPLELRLIQINFNAVIEELVGKLVDKYSLILPILSVYLEDIARVKDVYFEIPETNGNGFLFWFVFDKNQSGISSLLVQSSCCGEKITYECKANGWSVVEGHRKKQYTDSSEDNSHQKNIRFQEKKDSETSV